MTCWLSACRSAISVDACSSRAPADRTLSASEPLSSATAKNPNTLSATVYCATDRGGSDTASAAATAVVQQPAAGRYCAEHEADVEHRAQRRDQQAAAPELRRCCRRRSAARTASEKKLVMPPVRKMNADTISASHGQLQVDQPAVALD